MEAQEIVKVLNSMMDLADTMDKRGSGAYALTKGRTSTREALKTELARFLLYVSNGNAFVSSGEAAVINLALGIKADQKELTRLAAEVGEPDPEEILSLGGFMLFDRQVNNGEFKYATMLIETFSALGDLIVAFDDNKIARSRNGKFVTGMLEFLRKVELLS